MLESLKQSVYEANMELVRRGLVIFTWGNVSGIDRERGLMVIKPSGVKYEELTPEKMVVTDLSGNVVEGSLNPSSDTQTHIELYKAFPAIGGVVHTHSTYATAWAQAEKDLPCFGTTHADNFHGAVPCTPNLSAQQVEEAYELNTGKCIVETFRTRGLDETAVPAVLCAHHGPFAWGKNPAEAVGNAAVLEEVSHMAVMTLQINSQAEDAPEYVQEKHYQRKHGKNATYGQQ